MRKKLENLTWYDYKNKIVNAPLVIEWYLEKCINEKDFNELIAELLEKGYNPYVEVLEVENE